MNFFSIALQFLTIFPVKITAKIEDADFDRALFFFPIVGILIGLVLSVIVILFGFLPGEVLSVCIVAASIFLTGGIHLDGFIDTCDGFYGNRPKKEILEIMRDSRVGAMGVIGAVVLLLLKFVLIANLPRFFLCKTLVMAMAFSRWAQALACFASHYAREKGKAEFFIKYAAKKDVILGAVVTFCLFFLMAGLKSALIFFPAFFMVLLFIKYIKKRISGMTGDTIGAISEASEIVVLLLAQLAFF